MKNKIKNYLKQNKVVVPKRLSILPHFEKNGDVIIAPIIMGENGEEIPFNDDFQKSFDARNDVKTVYNGTGVYYVIKPEVEEALKEIGAVVEGYYATDTVKTLAAKYGIEMPISEGAYQVLYNGKKPKEILTELMQRDKKHEIEDASW